MNMLIIIIIITCLQVAGLQDHETIPGVTRKKISHLERSVERLSLLQAHDTLCLLKNALAMPKLQHILRTSPCASNPLSNRWSSSQWTIQDPQCQTERFPMETGITASSDGQTRSEKLVHAATFSLFGFGCSHTITPECHSTRIVA